MTVCRVVLVGKSGSGKTSLVKALINKPGESTLQTSATIGVSLQALKADDETPLIQFWDFAERMVRRDRCELVIYVIDSTGDYNEQKAFLLSHKNINAPRGMLVVTKAASELISQIQGPNLDNLAHELGINHSAIYFADSKDPQNSCKGLRDKIKECARLSVPYMQPAGGAYGEQAERDHLLPEEKRVTSATVAAEFGVATDVLATRINETQSLIGFINDLKEGTLLQMQTREISVAKGLAIAKSTTKLATALIEKHTDAERKTAISDYETETHPISRTSRYLGRLIGAVIGGAVGFVAGLIATTGLGPVAPIAALTAGSVAAKKGAAIGAGIGAAIGYGITYFCTRNKNSPRDEVVRHAKTFSNFRAEDERRMSSEEDDRGAINRGGRRSPLI